jgi:hypothetical protein
MNSLNNKIYDTPPLSYPQRRNQDTIVGLGLVTIGVPLCFAGPKLSNRYNKPHDTINSEIVVNALNWAGLNKLQNGPNGQLTRGQSYDAFRSLRESPIAHPRLIDYAALVTVKNRDIGYLSPNVNLDKLTSKLLTTIEKTPGSTPTDKVINYIGNQSMTVEQLRGVRQFQMADELGSLCIESVSPTGLIAVISGLIISYLTHRANKTLLLGNSYDISSSQLMGVTGMAAIEMDNSINLPPSNSANIYLSAQSGGDTNITLNDREIRDVRSGDISTPGLGTFKSQVKD